MTKSEWIAFFRDRADRIFAEVNLMGKDQKGKASEINKRIKVCRDRQLEITKATSVCNLWSNEKLLNEILLLTYASYVVMLEYRNKVWKYEYMAFARRIGELWEPFCKLPFEYPVKRLTIIAPSLVIEEALKLKLYKGGVPSLSLMSLKKLLASQSSLSVPWIAIFLFQLIEASGRFYDFFFTLPFSSL